MSEAPRWPICGISLALANVALNDAINFSPANFSSRGIWKFRGASSAESYPPVMGRGGKLVAGERAIRVCARCREGEWTPDSRSTEFRSCGAEGGEEAPRRRNSAEACRAVRKRREKVEVYTGFDVLTAMQWPPPRSLSARRVSLPRCRRRGPRQTGVEREGRRRCRCPRQEPPRTIEGDSHVSIGITRLTLVVRSHLCSPHHTRTRASTLDAGLRGFVATAHGQGPRNAEEKSFFFGLDAGRRIDVWCYTSQLSFLILRMCPRLGPSRGAWAYSMTRRRAGNLNADRERRWSYWRAGSFKFALI